MPDLQNINEIFLFCELKLHFIRNNIEMKVIYAGFSKCATKSVAKALRSLGLKVYDFMDHYEHLRSDWMKIHREGATVERLRRMYEGVDAVTGMPVYYYWEELLEAFPEAKVGVLFINIIKLEDIKSEKKCIRKY